MTRAGWRLIEAMARCLAHEERDAVLGDLAEAEESAWAAARDVLGLIARRQASLWRLWQPWVALVGAALLAGGAIRAIGWRLAADLAMQISTYAKYGVRFENGLTATQETVVLLCLAAALAGWSWTCGFAMGSLAGRAVWIPGAVFGVVMLNGPRIAVLLLIPALMGARAGVRRRVLPAGAAGAVAAAILTITVLVIRTGGWYAHAHEVWSGGLWRGQPPSVPAWQLLAAGWPAMWLLTAAISPTKGKVKTT
jgi:hypothetical protein